MQWCQREKSLMISINCSLFIRLVSNPKHELCALLPIYFTLVYNPSHILDLRDASPMAGDGSPRQLQFLFPHTADVVGYPHCIRGNAREASPRETDSVESTLSFPPVWEWRLGKPIFGEEITSLQTQTKKCRSISHSSSQADIEVCRHVRALTVELKEKRIFAST